MKMQFVTLTAAGLLAASAGMAQTTTTTTTTTTVSHVWNDPHTWWGNHWAYNAADRYTANELSLDMFGSYLAGEKGLENLFDHSIRRHGTWGGGAGLNYFFTREIGIGGDILIPNDGGNFVNNIDGSLIARLPIANSGLAP